jgi:SAM-dependent methyltransferase
MSQVTRGSADFSWARKLTTDEWCAALAEGDYHGHVLPPNPPDALQSRYVGSSGIDAYRHAAVFWQHVKSIMLSVDHPLDCSQSRVLDFGVGWGRLYRYLLREFNPDNIVGMDVLPEAIDTCRHAMPFGTFHLIPTAPPYPDYGSFDLIYLYSIFSHLSEERFVAVLGGLRDMLKPGGVIAFTTLLYGHLGQVWAKNVDDRFYGPQLRAAGFDAAEWDSAALRGDRALFLPSGGGNDITTSEFFGETILTEAFLRKRLPELGCRLVHFSEPKDMPQAMVAVMRAI